MPRWNHLHDLLQGTRDYVVDIEAGRYLHSLAKRPAAPYWAQGCHHENVEMSSGYVPHLRRFLQASGLWD